MLEDLAEAGCGVLLIEFLADDQEVFLRPMPSVSGSLIDFP
jgi:hypothetical protein